eukprot:TRINITY_DN616_c0_g5_i1.p1 TRINITY_DN616_c0_g5~~TRINITY_DN616_c0_g5_i1.p1  ORF type:complete len:333 (+),score=83.02 TRINITY_DN616_c0_g5_i1:142-1140(+)
MNNNEEKSENNEDCEDNKIKLRIITFNVHYFKDERDICNVNSLIKLFKELKPDILCLQEVTTFSPSHDSGILLKISSKLNLPYEHSSLAPSPIRNIIPDQYDTILSNIPFKKKHETVLTYKKKQKRGFSFVQLDLSFHGLSDIFIGTTHIDQAFENVRLKQFDQIQECIKEVSMEYHNENDDQEDLNEGYDDDNEPKTDLVPHIICGDFNVLCKKDYTDDQWQEIYDIRAKNRWELPKDTFYNTLTNELEYHDSFYCFNKDNRNIGNDNEENNESINDIENIKTCRYNTRIDYIFLSNNIVTKRNIKIINYERIDTRISDHFPVLIDFEIYQ